MGQEHLVGVGVRCLLPLPWGMARTCGLCGPMPQPMSFNRLPFPRPQEFVNIMDVNNDGSISYEEFIATLKTQTGADGPALPPGKEGEGKEAAATTFESPLKRTKSIDHRKAAKARSNTMERSRCARPEACCVCLVLPDAARRAALHSTQRCTLQLR